VTAICTASWSALYAHRDRLDVTPVRISRGGPRYWPEAADFPAVELLMPDGWMMGIADFEKFGRCYRRKLHIAGLPAVMAALDAIPANRVALTCFEPDCHDCHRGPAFGFARWWFGKTGELIAEWEPPNLAKTTWPKLTHSETPMNTGLSSGQLRLGEHDAAGVREE
jgi:hypothetical protein